jgi:hypothetical protein
LISPTHDRDGFARRRCPSTRVAGRAVTEDVTKTPALDSSFR